MDLYQLVGPEARKLHPRLRMVANARTEVNAIRAELDPSVAVKSQGVLRSVAQVRGPDAVPLDFEPAMKSKRGRIAELPDGVFASVFVGLTEEARVRRTALIPGETARQGDLVTADIPMSRLRDVAVRELVSYAELGERLVPPRPRITAEARLAPPPGIRRVPPTVPHGGGKGVLIGIIDVDGFDFSHSDFLDEQGRTRFLRIWDQGGSARPHPKAFSYGAEFLQEHLNAALDQAGEVGVAPYDLEKQSQVVAGSHGTHVTSIAAGSFGLCPEAKIAAVLVGLEPEDFDRRRSFYDSTRIAHAVKYLLDFAEEEGLPISINVSLGTNGHAHDASSAVCRWIDSALATPGRSICVAAGNAGQEAPDSADDFGYIMGRIHTSGRVAARGLEKEIEWVVVGNGIADISENELEIWYGAQDRLAVQLKPPGQGWLQAVEPGQFIENLLLDDGTMVSVYNELYYPANGSNYISIYLSPFFSEERVTGVRAGKWLVKLVGLDVRDGTYDGWVERDDPVRRGQIGPQQAWSFPSFFSERSNVDRSSVSSLACGQRVISVANLDEAGSKINVSSSQGPTRDGRPKPEIAAPGTEIIAANGFAGPDDLWIKMTGTSMASPYVAGVVGLMLAVEKELTAAQIGGIIKRTARPLPGSDFSWKSDEGFGRIDPEACLREAVLVNQRKDLAP